MSDNIERLQQEPERGHGKHIDLVMDDKTGELEVEAFNFRGPACKAATRVFLDALGGTTSEKLKPEYRRQELRQHRRIGDG